MPALCGQKVQAQIVWLPSLQDPMKKAGKAFPSHVTEGETEAQRGEGIIIVGISRPTQFPTLGLNTGINVAELK